MMHSAQLQTVPLLLLLSRLRTLSLSPLVLACRNSGAAWLHAPALVVPPWTPNTPPQWPAGGRRWPACSHDAHSWQTLLPPPTRAQGPQGHVRCVRMLWSNVIQQSLPLYQYCLECGTICIRIMCLQNGSTAVSNSTQEQQQLF